MPVTDCSTEQLVTCNFSLATFRRYRLEKKQEYTLTE